MNPNQEAYNLIIAGVGGQGNVLFSQLIGQSFISKAYFVSIGETYGASQRGGSVMSHIRISKNNQKSPLIPRGKADIIVALEPMEGLRVLTVYGNSRTVTVINPRPIYPINVISGDDKYPKNEEIKGSIEKLSKRVYYIEATEKAMQIGSPIFANMIMIGALLELSILPLSVKEFRETLSVNFNEKKLQMNFRALEEGRRCLRSSY